MKLSNQNIETEIARLRAENPDATIMFWYSKIQYENSIEFSRIIGENYNYKFFQGKPYSEVRSFEDGLDTKFEDMELLGIGTYNDGKNTI